MTAPAEPSLKRGLTLFSSTMLVVGLIIGTGVFKKIVPMAQTGLDGNYILLAWLAAGIITLLGAFTLAGLASLTDESGGIYEYFRFSFGNFVAFLSGWTDYLIISSGAVAALAFLFGQTINIIVPLPDPLQSFKDVSVFGAIQPFAESGIKLVGIGTMVILAAVNCLGIKESSVLNNSLTCAKIFGVLTLAYFGISHSMSSLPVDAEVISTTNSPEGMMFFSAFMTAMLGAFWGYNGWEVATNISGEMINPRRNMALAMIFGVLIIMTIYLVTNYSYLHVLSIERLRSIDENGIAGFVVAETIFGPVGRTLLLILFLLCVFGALNSNMVSVPRKYFRMAQEGYFFESARLVHPKFRTPYMALIFTLIAGCILLLSGSFDLLTDMVIFTSFLFYGLLAIAVLKLKSNGTIKIRLIGYPVVPILFMLFSFAFCANHIWTQPWQSLVGLSLVLSGIPFYYYFKGKLNRSGNPNHDSHD